MIHHSNHLDPEVRKAKSWGFLLSNIPNPQKLFQQGVLDLLLGDNTSAKHLFPRDIFGMVDVRYASSPMVSRVFV